MQFVSINDIGRSIIKTTDIYNRELGSFSAFMNPERKAAFHRINMEYMQVLANKSLNDIALNLRDCAKINAELLNVNYNINSTLSDIADITYKSYLQVQNTNEILNEILIALKNPNSTAASEKARIASQNILDAKSMKSSRAKILLDEAIMLLEDSIIINPIDYKAHFDLGWLYSYYKNDYNKSEFCFDNAVLRSLQKDKNFAVFALRHLADTRQNMNNTQGALESIKEAVDLNSGDQLQTRFEYAQYLIKDNQIDKAKRIVNLLIDKTPQIFECAISDPIFNESDVIKNLLQEKLNDRISTVKESLEEKNSEYFIKSGELEFSINVYTKKGLFGSKHWKTLHTFQFKKETINKIKDEVNNLILIEVKQFLKNDSFEKLRNIHWILTELLYPISDEADRREALVDKKIPWRHSSEFDSYEQFKIYDDKRKKQLNPIFDWRDRSLKRIKEEWKLIDVADELSSNIYEKVVSICIKEINNNIDSYIPKKYRKDKYEISSELNTIEISELNL